jgi:2-polyprenyl-3-methyl-5-hydroxy-6-metoxy-1,4-benzoquinol methylase
MDQPGLDARRHLQALGGLERINFWSGSARMLWPGIRALARDQGPRPLRLLDVASGAGDVPLRLWRKARRSGLALAIDGCDVSPRAVQYAQAQAALRVAGAESAKPRTDGPGLCGLSPSHPPRFFVWDALRDPLPRPYDIVTSSLFLHHLAEEDAVRFLARMSRLAGRLLLINDLVRGPFGFLLAYLGTRLLSSSSVVHTDGPRSVEAAFRCPEVRSLARRAGLEGARVERRWPCRFLLTWRPSS